MVDVAFHGRTESSSFVPNSIWQHCCSVRRWLTAVTKGDSASHACWRPLHPSVSCVLPLFLARFSPLFLLFTRGMALYFLSRREESFGGRKITVDDFLLSFSRGSSTEWTSLSSFSVSHSPFCIVSHSPRPFFPLSSSCLPAPFPLTLAHPETCNSHAENSPSLSFS